MSLGISFGIIGNLIAELEAFNNASGPELENLYDAAKEAVDGCAGVLKEFKDKVERKYEGSLHVVSGAKKMGAWETINVAGKKVLWLKEKDDILELRRKLQMRSEAITMCVLAAIGRSQKLDHVAQPLRINAVHKHLHESLDLAREHKLQLQSLDQKMDAQIDAQRDSSVAIVSNIRNGITMLAQVGDLVSEIRNILIGFQRFTALQQGPAPGLGAHWHQAPVTLEDAHGNLIPIPLSDCLS